MEENREIKHNLKNKLAILNNCVLSVSDFLPSLIEAYKEGGHSTVLSPKLLSSMPKLLDHALNAIREMELEVDQLKS